MQKPRVSKVDMLKIGGIALAHARAFASCSLLSAAVQEGLTGSYTEEAKRSSSGLVPIDLPPENRHCLKKSVYCGRGSYAGHIRLRNEW